MKIRELQKIIREDIPDLKHAMNMSTWNVVFSFEKIDNPACDAHVTSFKPYEDACIVVDALKMNGRADFLRAIRHEFLHCLMPDHALLCAQLEEVLPKKTFKVIDKMLSSIEERAVMHIEHLLDFGLGFTAVKMVRRGRRKVL